MIIRQAKEAETDNIRKLAEQFDLDSEDMPAGEFLVAEENKEIIGFVRLKNNKTCFELTSLGVIKKRQGQGIGKKLVEAIVKESSGFDLYLATIIPQYFEKFGFKKVEKAPPCIKKDPAWCEGCPAPEKCVIMKYEHP